MTSFLWKPEYASSLNYIFNSCKSQEKEQKIYLARLKKQKMKLDKRVQETTKTVFPIPDELISQVDGGSDSRALPIPAMRLNVPDELSFDVIFVWDFICTFT